MVRAAKSSYIPTWIEHDPTVPPVGRIVDARLIRLDDGVFAVEADQEIWDSDDDPSTIVSDGRDMVIAMIDSPTFEIGIDLGTMQEEGDALKEELVALRCSNVSTVVQRSALSAMTIVVGTGTFVIGAIASGFLQELGKDGYVKVKEWLQERVRKRAGDQSGATPATPSRIQFTFTVKSADREVQVDVVIESPSDLDIEAFMGSGVRQLDALVTQVLSLEPQARRLLIRQENQVLVPGFVVRRDCYPLGLTTRPPDR